MDLLNSVILNHGPEKYKRITASNGAIEDAELSRYDLNNNSLGIKITNGKSSKDIQEQASYESMQKQAKDSQILSNADSTDKPVFDNTGFSKKTFDPFTKFLMERGAKTATINTTKLNEVDKNNKKIQNLVKLSKEGFGIKATTPYFGFGDREDFSSSLTTPEKQKIFYDQVKKGVLKEYMKHGDYGNEYNDYEYQTLSKHFDEFPEEEKNRMIREVYPTYDKQEFKERMFQEGIKDRVRKLELYNSEIEATNYGSNYLLNNSINEDSKNTFKGILTAYYHYKDSSQKGNKEEANKYYEIVRENISKIKDTMPYATKAIGDVIDLNDKKRLSMDINKDESLFNNSKAKISPTEAKYSEKINTDLTTNKITPEHFNKWLTNYYTLDGAGKAINPEKVKTKMLNDIDTIASILSSTAYDKNGAEKLKDSATLRYNALMPLLTGDVRRLEGVIGLINKMQSSDSYSSYKNADKLNNLKNILLEHYNNFGNIATKVYYANNDKNANLPNDYKLNLSSYELSSVLSDPKQADLLRRKASRIASRFSGLQAIPKSTEEQKIMNNNADKAVIDALTKSTNTLVQMKNYENKVKILQEKLLEDPENSSVIRNQIERYKDYISRLQESITQGDETQIAIAKGLIEGGNLRSIVTKAHVDAGGTGEFNKSIEAMVKENEERGKIIANEKTNLLKTTEKDKSTFSNLSTAMKEVNKNRDDKYKIDDVTDIDSRVYAKAFKMLTKAHPDVDPRDLGQTILDTVFTKDKQDAYGLWKWWNESAWDSDPLENSKSWFWTEEGRKEDVDYRANNVFKIVDNILKNY